MNAWRLRIVATAWLAALVMSMSAAASDPASTTAPPAPAAPGNRARDAEAITTAVARGVEILLERQEGDDRAEWPYEGVYRVSGEIPIGYRVGGTGIAAMALMAAPGLDGDAARRAAIERAIVFIIDAADHPLMSTEVIANYDVRGWGHTYGLLCLLDARARGAVPTKLAEASDATIRRFIAAIEALEIPETGGWSYARRAGFDKPGPASPFMTGPTLQALFEAKRQGFDVTDEVVERGLDALEAARTESGAFAYAAMPGRQSRDGTPGTVGRMVCAESTLLLAGRSDAARVRGAVDAFIVHWDWLEQRRAKQGTHAPPYGVAPYYFFFAHYHAARAVELLPERERAEYRRRVNELLFSVQEEDGSWNDRVFERSAAYGTAMAMLALRAAELGPLARWPQEEQAPAAAEDASREPVLP